MKEKISDASITYYIYYQMLLLCASGIPSHEVVNKFAISSPFPSAVDSRRRLFTGRGIGAPWVCDRCVRIQSFALHSTQVI